LGFGFRISCNNATILRFLVAIHDFSLILQELDVGFIEKFQNFPSPVLRWSTSDGYSTVI